MIMSPRVTVTTTTKKGARVAGFTKFGVTPGGAFSDGIWVRSIDDRLGYAAVIISLADDLCFHVANIEVAVLARQRYSTADTRNLGRR